MKARRFEGKRVLITGAASGIAKACAEAFAAEGAALALGDLNRAGVNEVAERLAKTHGIRASAHAYDAEQSASCRALVDAGVAALGGLDVLCNVAGIMDWAPFDQFTDARWERMLRINLSGVFTVTHQAMPRLVAAKGNIVNLASAAGLLGIAYTSAYCAAKAGVVSLTKSLAIEFAAKGVRVNAVCPSGVDTPMMRNTAFPDGVDAALLARNAPKLERGRPLTAEEVAASVLFLASPAANMITGVALPVDGGQLAG
jgi:NAD(P)-dependent dehydrogenase (short-subunit alcohol dehydrogenase family)